MSTSEDGLLNSQGNPAEAIPSTDRADCALVFHHIIADGFHVDHVVISSKGIHVIETKTYSKPKGRDASVRYDGRKLVVDGKPPSRDPGAFREM